MPQSLPIPADVLLLLRQEALSDYSLACERASIAAEACAVTSEHGDKGVRLRTCRTGVIAADEALTAVGAGATAAEAGDVSIDDANRDMISTRVGLALDRISSEFESSAPEIVDAANRIRCLRGLLCELDAGMAGDGAGRARVPPSRY